MLATSLRFSAARRPHGRMAASGAGLAHVYSIRIRPGGSKSSYRLARSDRPIGTNPLIFAVCSAGTPDFSSLLAIKPRKGMGKSKLRSSTTRAARRKQNLQVEQLRRSPIKALESLIRVLDEIGRDDSLRPCVERSSVEQEPERRKIGSAVPLGPCKRQRDVAKATHQFRLGVVVDQFQGSSQADIALLLKKLPLRANDADGGTGL